MAGQGKKAQRLILVLIFTLGCVAASPKPENVLYERVLEPRDNELAVRQIYSCDMDIPLEPCVPSCYDELEEVLLNPSPFNIRARADCTWDRELFLMHHLYILEEYITGERK